MKRIMACILAIAITFSLMSYAYADSKLSQNTTMSKQEKTLSSYLTKNKVSKIDSNYILDACKIGIADYKLAGNGKDKISISNLVKLFENAYRLRYGKDSKYLAGFQKNISSIKSCDKDGKATRYNVAELVFYGTSEIDLGIKYKSFQGFITAVDNQYAEDPYSYLNYPDSAIMIENKNGTVNSNANIWGHCADLKAIEAVGNPNTVNFVVRAFDRTSGERVMSLYEDTTYRPNNKIDVKTAILAVYHYYRYLMPEPQNVVLEKVGTYNKNIITDALLKQKTSLPNATNAKLPEWKGFNVDHLSGITHGALSDMPEYWVYESDIKTIAETGANFANVRIGWGGLSAPDFVSDDSVNLYYLESLDRILSWGIKYGVHIQFCFTEGPAMDKTFNMQQARDKTMTVFTDKVYRKLNVRYWRMLSKRYAKISNNYLSFCLMNEPVPLSDKNYAESMKPSIDAIWEEAPDRVILADIHSNNCTGESMAALGVALCYHHYRPNELFVVQKGIKLNYKEYYKNLFVPSYSMTGTLYSEEAATSTWEGKGDTSKLGGKPDIIKGNISGTIEIMLKDSTVGKAALLIKADGKVIYEDVPETVSDGDPEVDVCYSAVPTIVSIPEGTKQLELSCNKFCLSFGSVKIRRNDGVIIDIPVLTDNFQGADMSTVTVHEDGSFESDHRNDKQLFINLKSPLISIMECKATAEKYGVGFMCGEFGFFDNGGGTIRKSAIPYEDLTNILTGVIQTFDKNGIPWCGEYRTSYTLTNSYPLNTGTTYKKIEGSSLYLDSVMNKFYKNIIAGN